MLPYQAVAMDYAVASAGFHHQRGVGQGVPGVMGLGSPAFTHSWFVQPAGDLCRPNTTNQSHLEPGHVMFYIYTLIILYCFVLLIMFCFVFDSIRQRRTIFIICFVLLFDFDLFYFVFTHPGRFYNYVFFLLLLLFVFISKLLLEHQTWSNLVLFSLLFLFSFQLVSVIFDLKLNKDHDILPMARFLTVSKTKKKYKLVWKFCCICNYYTAKYITKQKF